jgi:16S rRNA C967 or C1407 C5-methylase (RsmB/RsmF family)
MLPPLLLDVSPGQYVLDMCAAPGSKTAQIVEMLEGTGLVIANDVDINRAFMMVHQLHRANTANLLVTNHPAQQFPGLIKYQRVLCDVPCSGDGTIRKAPTKWKTWSVKDAVGLHPLQVQIATKGFTLLEEGGLMLYSTCSLNPIEDEAVVNTLLKTLGSNVVLEDLPAIINQKYPGLRYRPGLSHWKVLANAHIPSASPFLEYTSVTDFPPGSKFRPSMLCEAPNMDLQKCVRIFPQDQNTGGFFLALLRKSGEVRKETEETEGKTQDKIPAPRRKVHKGITEYLEVTEDSDEYQSISDYYGFSEDFPHGSLFTPSAVHKKNIYMISTAARKVLDLDDRKALRVLNMGVKAFSINKERASTQDCRYRICQDAAPFLFQYLTKRTYVSHSAIDFTSILTHKQLNLSDLSDPELKSALSSTNGYFVLHFQADQIDEIIVILKHIDDKIILMIPEELVRGLKLLYDLE